MIATRALRTAGLAALATEARDAARDRLLERWTGAAYRPTWAGGLNWGVSSGRAEDRAAVVAALEDAALAAVAEGIAPDDVVAALGGDGDAILGMATGGPAEESLAAAVHVAAVADSRLAGAGLVIFLVLIVAPTLLVAGTVAASVGELGVVSVSTGALVLVGSVAVLVVRRARRAIGNQSDAG